MARGDIEITRTDSLRSEFERLHQAISQRAYELFRHRDSWSGGPLVDWLSAEHELIWQPPVELRQKDGQFELLAAVAGVKPKNLDVQVTPEDVLIKADVDHQHTAESSAVHLCEFSRGKVFRFIHLPEKNRSRLREGRVSRWIATSHGVNCQTEREDCCAGGITNFAQVTGMADVKQ